jgi:hypothetical protein
MSDFVKEKSIFKYINQIYRCKNSRNYANFEKSLK